MHIKVLAGYLNFGLALPGLDPLPHRNNRHHNNRRYNDFGDDGYTDNRHGNLKGYVVTKHSHTLQQDSIGEGANSRSHNQRQVFIDLLEARVGKMVRFILLGRLETHRFSISHF